MMNALRTFFGNDKIAPLVIGALVAGLLAALGWAWKQEIELTRQRTIVDTVIAPLEIERRLAKIEGRLEVTERRIDTLAERK